MKQNWYDFIVPLYNEEYERMLKVAYRRTKSWELAQDLVQDVFLLAIFNQAKIKKHPKPSAWLMQTLQNLIMNEMRSMSRQDIPLDEAKETPARSGTLPLDSLLPTQLQPKEREILILRFEQEMSYPEMSKHFAVSEDVCRQWVSKAINKCREYLRG